MSARKKTAKPTKSPSTGGDAVVKVVEGILNSFATHGALAQMGELGAKLGESRFAARLQARATVFAALHTAPRAEGKRTVDSEIEDAVAIVARLEAAVSPAAAPAKKENASGFGYFGPFTGPDAPKATP